MIKKRWSIVLALGCGLACAIAVGQFLGHIENQTNEARAEAMERYGGEQTQVIVATADIAPGEEITASNTAAKMWLVEMLPDQAVSERNQIAGLKATTEIKSGEVLNLSRFKEEEEKKTSIPQGLCGVGVEVQDSQTASAALEQGSYVDVYAVSQDSVKRICIKAPVISSENSSGHAYWVTLAVKPSQVQEVLAASKNASLYLVLPGASVPTDQSNEEVEEREEKTEEQTLQTDESNQGGSSSQTSSNLGQSKGDA